MTKLDERLIRIVPAERQIALQQMEFYAFVHFGMNTFTDREWGTGTEDPAIFNPEKLDASQWTEAIKAAGMTGLILTCKHHDGFCLWPSKYTRHSVAASSYRNGQGDIVAEVAEACQKAGLRFGVYLSPWDRNQPCYGSGEAYNDFFINQLTELLTGYGDVFSVWLDGACGEGPNGKKQYYDWDRIYRTVRELQPNACIHVCGPDIRWCGNEAGDTRPCEWSVVPSRTANTETIRSSSQQEDDAAFRKRPIRAEDQDLGSRAILANEPDLIWYPAEVNTSIRPGWFWHASENNQVKPLAKLIDIYEKSAGGNATFLLNLPPASNGLLHENDVQRLHEFGQYLQQSYACNLAETAALETSPAKEGCMAASILVCDDTYYMPAASGCEITLRWSEEQAIRRVVLQEQIRLSQRIEHFTIEAQTGGEWKQVYDGTVVGYKRIAVLDCVCTCALRIRITDSRCEPTLRFLGVYADC